MNKKLLWTLTFEDGKLQLHHDEYIVRTDELGISVSKNGLQWNSLPLDVYETIYADDPSELAKKKMDWLTHDVLPLKIEALAEVTNKIKCLNDWLNDNT